MPPKRKGQELPLIVQLFALSVPPLSTLMPPPSLFDAFAVIAIPLRLSVPFVQTRTAPPSPCTEPPLIVKLLNVTVIDGSGGLNGPGESTSKTRSIPPPLI